MGFTHAYFPLFAFDQWTLADKWLFARKDDGYVALMSTSGMELVKSGRYAYRELRSYANRTIWICQMGSKRRDGSFSAFREQRAADACGVRSFGSHVYYDPRQ